MKETRSEGWPTHEDFANVVVRSFEAYGDKPAVIDNGRRYSFGELGLMSQRVAERLGSDPGVIAVHLSSSVHTVATFLGIVISGGTYCPISPTFPAKRQRMMAEMAGCQLQINTAPRHAPAWQGHCLDGVELCETNVDGNERTFRVGPQGRPAYVLFTSGSTGKPKGVLTPRYAVAAATRSLVSLLGIEARDRTLQFASLCWDTCFEEILPGLVAGAALVIDKEAASGSVPRLLTLLRTQEVSVLNLPTAFWHEVVHYLKETGDEMPLGVRTVIVGGEAMRASALEDWCGLRHTARIRLVNTYGCTETTMVTHAIDLHGPRAGFPAGHWQKTSRVPIGYALSHVIESVTEDGELIVAGPSLALGYLGHAQLMAERFVNGHPKGPQLRSYRTGDCVARDGSGALVHLRRVDNEVKVRGIQVNPAEVEHAIGDHPAVVAVAVVADLLVVHTSLVAYVVLRSDEDAQTQSRGIVAELQTRVPSHLVPAKVTVVPSLVYTDSGKIDRVATHRRYRSNAPSKRLPDEG